MADGTVLSSGSRYSKNWREERASTRGRDWRRGHEHYIFTGSRENDLRQCQIHLHTDVTLQPESEVRSSLLTQDTVVVSRLIRPIVYAGLHVRLGHGDLFGHVLRIVRCLYSRV